MRLIGSFLLLARQLCKRGVRRRSRFRLLAPVCPADRPLDGDFVRGRPPWRVAAEAALASARLRRLVSGGTFISEARGWGAYGGRSLRSFIFCTIDL